MKRPNYSVLEYAGARRVKRTWGATVLAVLAFLAVTALCGWVVMKYKCSVLSAQCLVSQSQSLPVSESPLVLAGVNDWLAVGIVGLMVALLVVRWVWRVVVGGDEAEGDPLAETAVGLVPEEVGRIVDACRREARAVMMLIEAAQTALCADDVTDMLRLADGKMKQLVRTLGELQREVNTSAQCSVLSGEAWPFCKACESWHAKDLKCVGSVGVGELKQEITEGTEKTANVDELGLCSRCHGMAYPRGVDWTNGDLTNAWDADKSVRAPVSESPSLSVSQSSTKGGQV